MDHGEPYGPYEGDRPQVGTRVVAKEGARTEEPLGASGICPREWPASVAALLSCTAAVGGKRPSTFASEAKASDAPMRFPPTRQDGCAAEAPQCPIRGRSGAWE